MNVQPFWNTIFSPDPSKTGFGNLYCRWQDGVNQFQYNVYTGTDTASLLTAVTNAQQGLITYLTTLPSSSSTALTVNNLLSAPTITNIAGLNTVISNQGWNIISDRTGNPGCGLIGPKVFAGNAYRNSCATGITCRSRHIAVIGASHIVLAYLNTNNDNSAGENPGRCTIKIEAYMQKNGSTGVTDQTGSLVRVLFSGKEIGEVPPDGILLSDPIPFDVVSGEIYFVNTYLSSPGTNYAMPVCNDAGGTSYGEGSSPDNNLTNGTITTNALGTNFYYPATIFGYTGGISTPTLALVGDSIVVGVNDTNPQGISGYTGGYLERTILQQNSLGYASSGITPLYPFIKLGRGGETMVSYSTRNLSQKRLRLSEFASTVILEYGINDVIASTPLATLKTNALAITSWYTNRGRKVIWCTLLPNTTSTDGFQTITNQTVGANESIRTGFNSWLRDTSTAGYVIQASASGLVDFLEVAGLIEVNSSGIITLNGGFWPAALSTSDLTGTLTGVSGSTYTDSTQTPLLNQYSGYNIVMTSGSAANKTTSIVTNTTGGAFFCNTTLSPAPSNGDAYKLYRPYSVDGTHPTSAAAALLSKLLSQSTMFSKLI